jgi:hypothetical protein
MRMQRYAESEHAARNAPKSDHKIIGVKVKSRSLTSKPRKENCVPVQSFLHEPISVLGASLVG